MLRHKFGIPEDKIDEVFKISEHENSFEQLRMKSMKEYNNYFSHYEMYTILLAFLASIGLYLTIYMWEATFNPVYRLPDTTDPNWH